MSQLDMLRQRAAKQRAEREKVYAANVREAVSSVLQGNDGLITMSILNNGGKDVLLDRSATEKVVTEVTRSVTAAITNPVDNFVGILRERGISPRRQHTAVDQIYEMYFSELNKDPSAKSAVDVPYEVKREAVALKLEMEPSLWDTISYLQKIEER